MRSLAPIWASLSRILASRCGPHRRRAGQENAAVRWIEIAELMQRLGHGAIIVDVRGPDEFSGPLGHIPGAINLPLQTLQVRLDDLAPFRAKAVLLVCHTDKRSAAAASLLRAHGFRDVGVLRGGMLRWRAEGMPVEEVAAT